MPDLVEVRIGNNRISKVETLAFSGNPKLKSISLRDNQIHTIARNSFDQLEQMEFLDFADNALTIIGNFINNNIEFWLD